MIQQKKLWRFSGAQIRFLAVNAVRTNQNSQDHRCVHTQVSDHTLPVAHRILFRTDCARMLACFVGRKM
jgi:hypothetical protein